MIKHIPVAKLQRHWSVLSEDGEPDVWGTKVTVEKVKICIENFRFEPRSYQSALTDDTYDHAARIAHLCVNRDFTPIEIDVGIPSLGYFNFDLTDGNHRLAASIVNGDATIPSSVAGETNYIEHLFFAPRPEYAHI